ncbi:hypothetical protein [Salinicola aestuarinus]|uniref:hypothetical protein n=1 Tax=Salinicola aestuarinus TaxID=1949082 RepID=UPI000DA228A8|nr:hypothetical protein [Salinicola aestuarinus]
MTQHRRTDNAAWHAAERWRERVNQTRPNRGSGGLRLVLTWLLFGAVLIIGTVLGLFFLVVGWAMLPFLRHRMKKHAEQVRASQATYAGGSADTPHSAGDQRVLDGEYEVRNER